MEEEERARARLFGFQGVWSSHRNEVALAKKNMTGHFSGSRQHKHLVPEVSQINQGGCLCGRIAVWMCGWTGHMPVVPETSNGVGGGRKSPTARDFPERDLKTLSQTQLRQHSKKLLWRDDHMN